MMHLILSAVLTLTHVSVIDVRTGRVQRDTTLKVQSDVDRVVDGSGKFVIPALWDMHTHLPDDAVGRNAYLPLFVANGVTGIRVMEGSPELYRWREEIRRGHLLGPRMVVASAIIDGPRSFLPDAVKVSTTAEARRAVRRAKREGADFVKVYDNLSRTAYGAIISEARVQRLPVEGHVPTAMTVREVSRAGQKSIEHMMGIAAAGPEVFTVLRKNHTWECPTLIMRHNYAWLDDSHLAADPRLKYIRPSTRQRWLSMIGQSNADRKAIFAREQQLAGAMARAGVSILAGTDNGNPFCFPGFSLHDELALLVEAGLTPLQALQTATVNATRFLNIKNSADIVILDGNPLEDIANTKKINAVVIGGRLLDRRALDELLAESESASSH
ncbi:MAG TPA: amidohydrolase family protein [Thermoanaerobaculia bacterium]